MGGVGGTGLEPVAPPEDGEAIVEVARGCLDTTGQEADLYGGGNAASCIVALLNGMR